MRKNAANNLRHARQHLTKLRRREVTCKAGKQRELRANLAAYRWLRRIVVNRGAGNFVVDSIEINGIELLAMPVSAAIFSEDSTIGMLSPPVFTGAAEMVLRVTNVTGDTATFACTPYVQNQQPKGRPL
ncbi:hypothetical protein LCGC14_1123560 [marine sediment metagenome]|uniref:Uncharacterized protein n=1 Tax=marine sediment metagenome TaxID=412755 RepID=A0A0F9M820_9ZZZZ